MRTIRSVLQKLFGEREEEQSFALRFSNKDLAALILPLIAEQFLGVLMGAMDTMMVSSLGDASVSGVSLIDQIYVLFFSVLSALATGGAVVASRKIGAKKPREACRSALSLMFISLTASLLLLILVSVADVRLIRLLYGTIEPEVMDAAAVYMRTIAISFPAVGIYGAASALFRSMGNSRITMLASSAANLLNIAGNALCIFVLHWGVFGAALATVISRFVLAVFFLIRIKRPDQDIHFDFFQLFREKPDKKLARSILSVGLPGSLESGTFQLGRILVLSIISTFGTVQITANAVAGNIDNLGVMPGFAFQLAMITVVGQCLGAGDKKAVRYYTAKLLRLCWALFLVYDTILLFAALPTLLTLYKVSPDARDLAVKLIFIHNGIGIFLWTPGFVLPNALKAVGEARYVMIVAVLSMFIFRVGLSKILAGYGWGALGVWWAMIADWIIRITFFVLRWRKWCREKSRLAEY